jgi:hypothetical protein
MVSQAPSCRPAVRPAALAFARLFGADAARAVEYSFGADADRYGTMLTGSGPEFLTRVRQFGESMEFALRWSGAIRRVVAQVQPQGFFFKVDWRNECIERLTLYCRFERAVDEAILRSALAAAAPLAWEGPQPNSIGRLLGESSPRIIGLRVDSKGRYSTALYFRIRVPRSQFMCDQLPPLLSQLSMPESVATQIDRSLASLLGSAYPPMLGIDTPHGQESAILKLDVAGVFLAEALAFVSRMGAPEVRVRELGCVGRALRLELLNYVGTKFGPRGYVGWKLYMPIRPQASAWTFGPALRLAESNELGAHLRNGIRAGPW